MVTERACAHGREGVAQTELVLGVVETYSLHVRGVSMDLSCVVSSDSVVRGVESLVARGGAQRASVAMRAPEEARAHSLRHVRTP